MPWEAVPLDTWGSAWNKKRDVGEHPRSRDTWWRRPNKRHEGSCGGGEEPKLPESVFSRLSVRQHRPLPHHPPPFNHHLTTTLPHHTTRHASIVGSQ